MGEILTPFTRYLGYQEYALVFEQMRQFTKTRNQDTQDELWVVEHPPVFTLGLGASLENILDTHGIPVVQTDRGGEVTYHGPGQIVIYFLLDLKRNASNRLFARELVYQIEEAVLATLLGYHIKGIRKEKAPGIYIGDGVSQGEKIAALGLKIQHNGYTYHGVALNVDMDLTPFSWIHPCGYLGLVTTDMRSQGVKETKEEIQATFIKNILEKVIH